MDYGALLALFLTLAIFSYIYKETVIFRFAEHMFLGLATAHRMVAAYKYVVDNAWTPMMRGDFLIIGGFVFGILILLMLSKRTEWVSRWPLALMTGATVGLGVRALISVNFVRQISATFEPFALRLDALKALDVVGVLIGTVTTLAYFTFTYRHQGVLKVSSRIGRIVLMLGLGGYFGNVVMSRLTLLSGRVVEILKTLGLVPA